MKILLFFSLIFVGILIIILVVTLMSAIYQFSVNCWYNATACLGLERLYPIP